MEITFLGQAGLYIETRHGSVLCDPWFNPAYFGSWFPFPANDGIDPKAIGSPDYLYVSHLHHDHFDPEFLAEHVSKDATVLLPDYPVEALENELRAVGFSSFVKTRNTEPVELDGLTITIVALTAPTDGPIGDSALVVDDGETRVFNQNDAHPLDLETLQALGPHDAHFLQFSGAIWFPMVYRFRPDVKEAWARKKIRNQNERAFRYAEQVGATHVFPCAGPPCFLDDDLFHLNDMEGGDPSSIFPDQTDFLEYMREKGDERGKLVVPGSKVGLSGGACGVVHPLPDAEVEAIFADKRAYLEAYQERKRPLIEVERASWPRNGELLADVKELLEPLLEMAELTCAGINARVLLDCSPGDRLVVDFVERQVYHWGGQECRYRFWTDPRLVRACLDSGKKDWVNSLFLSCRFEAERDGKYNEYVYNFFKCLTPERLQYAEGYYEEQSPVHELWECDGYLVQRRCPHLKADLTRFAEVQDGILTCTMHGWQFELATGRCLTSDDRRLFTKPVAEVEAAG